MAVSYLGKKPGKIWRLWQSTRLLTASFRNKSVKKDARRMGASILTAVGMGIATYATHGLFPLIGGWITGAGILLTFVPAKMAFTKAAIIKKSGFGTSYMARAEKRWLEKRMEGTFFKRLSNRLKKFSRKMLLGLGVVAGSLVAGSGLSLGVIAAINLSGKAALATTLITGVFASMPVALGVGAGALALGLATTIICKKNLKAAQPRDKKAGNPWLPKKDIDSSTAVTPPKPAQNSFNTTAQPSPKTTGETGASQLDDARRKNREGRQRQRKNGL